METGSGGRSDYCAHWDKTRMLCPWVAELGLERRDTSCWKWPHRQCLYSVSIWAHDRIQGINETSL